MGKIVRLTESQLKEVIKRVINETETSSVSIAKRQPTNAEEFVAKGICTAKNGKVILQDKLYVGYGFKDYSLQSLITDFGFEDSKRDELIQKYCSGYNPYDDDPNITSNVTTYGGKVKLVIDAMAKMSGQKSAGVESKGLKWVPGEIIQYGMKNNDKVRELQKAMKMYGSRGKVLVTGFFGDMTNRGLLNNASDIYKDKGPVDEKTYNELMRRMKENITYVPKQPDGSGGQLQQGGK
jgi:hypothetical protein